MRLAGLGDSEAAVGSQGCSATLLSGKNTFPSTSLEKERGFHVCTCALRSQDALGSLAAEQSGWPDPWGIPGALLSLCFAPSKSVP